MDKSRLFIDSDIIIDLLAKRDDFLAAAELFNLIDEGKVEAVTTPVVLANVAFITEKYAGKSKVKRTMRALIDSIRILSMDEVTVRNAISSKFSDFEDAMQYFAAEDGNVEIIITRNKKDYSRGVITTMTAEEFVTAHKAKSNRPEV